MVSATADFSGVLFFCAGPAFLVRILTRFFVSHIVSFFCVYYWRHTFASGGEQLCQIRTE
jgi:hypothetical protein